MFKRRKGDKDSAGAGTAPVVAANTVTAPVRNVFAPPPSDSIAPNGHDIDQATDLDRPSSPLAVRPIVTDFWSTERTGSSNGYGSSPDVSVPAPAAAFRAPSSAPSPAPPLGDVSPAIDGEVVASDRAAPPPSGSIDASPAVGAAAESGSNALTDGPTKVTAPGLSTETPVVSHGDVAGVASVATASRDFSWEGPQDSQSQPTAVGDTTILPDVEPPTNDVDTPVETADVARVVEEVRPSAESDGELSALSPAVVTTPPGGGAKETTPEPTRITVDTLSVSDDDDDDDVDEVSVAPHDGDNNDDVIRIHLTVVDDEISKISIVGSGDDAQEWISAAARADRKKKGKKSKKNSGAA